jgi:Bacterial capsule synthesis protein PGA_cap
MYAQGSPLHGRLSRLVAALAVAGLSLVGCAPAGDEASASPRWHDASSAPSPTGASRSVAPSPSSAGPQTISLSATGDIVMGNAPGRLPSGGGKGFFNGVKKALAADLVMGNLEEPLTEDTGHRKCAPKSTGCHQFRAPPSYAAHLREGGFELMNQANNHGNDYGPAGYTNTQKALEEHGLAHTGARGEITVVDVEGITVAAVGFSSYSLNNNLTDIPAGKRLIAAAAKKADLVVVQVHMGGEGSGKTRVKPGTEMFLGENRGDPIRFSHAMIDAGADLIVGHGPHVMRAVEFYKGRLIAYSLGNFAGGGKTLSGNGSLKYGAILHVSLTPDGSFAGGKVFSTAMNAAGLPTRDSSNERGRSMIADLSADDFGDTAARIGDDGSICPPG